MEVADLCIWHEAMISRSAFWRPNEGIINHMVWRSAHITSRIWSNSFSTVPIWNWLPTTVPVACPTGQIGNHCIDLSLYHGAYGQYKIAYHFDCVLISRSVEDMEWFLRGIVEHQSSLSKYPYGTVWCGVVWCGGCSSHRQVRENIISRLLMSEIAEQETQTDEKPHGEEKLICRGGDNISKQTML